MTAKRKIAKGGGLVGAGVGLALYAVFGLMQGAAIGGTAGVVLANTIYGPGAMELMAGDLITRVIIGGGMLAGALVALIAFLAAGSLIGFSCGYVLSLIARESEAVRI